MKTNVTLKLDADLGWQTDVLGLLLRADAL